MSRRGRPKAQAKAKVAPTPPAVLPRTTQPAQPAQRAEVPQSTQPPPSIWNRAAFTWILIAIIAPRAIPLSPASAFRCLGSTCAGSGGLLRLVSQSVCSQTTFHLSRSCCSMAQPYTVCVPVLLITDCAAQSHA